VVKSELKSLLKEKVVQKDEALKSTLVPLGDGIIMIQKLEEKDYLPIVEALL